MAGTAREPRKIAGCRVSPFSQAGASTAAYAEEESHILRTVIENSFDVIAIVETDGTIRVLSPSFEDYFDYERSEMIGKSFLELVHPGDHGDAWEAFQDLVERRSEAKSLQARFVDRDGSWRFAEIRGRNLVGRQPVNGIFVCWHDVTAFKGLESRLGESERLYKALFDHSGDAIFVNDMRGRFLDVNQVACERLGYSREELLRMTPVDIDHPEFAALVPRRIREIREKGHLFIETAHVAKDGRVIPVEISARFMDHAGEPAIISVARDISERKEMERLNQARRDLATALGALSGLDEAFSRCLDVALELSGMDSGCIYLLEDDTGPGHVVCARGIPEDAVRMLRHDPGSPDMRLVRDGHPYYGDAHDFERIFGKPHPSKGIGAIAIVPILNRGVVEAYMRLGSHTIRKVPISARKSLEMVAAQMGSVIARLKAERALKESEAKFRSLVEQASAGIALADHEGRITFVNDALCRTLGYPERDMVGKSYAWFVHPDDLDTVVQQTIQLLAFPRLELQLEFRALRRDGRVIECLTQPRATLLDGEVIGYSAIIQDMTEVKRIERQDLALYDLGLTLGGCTDLESALTACLDTAIGMTGMDSGSIYMVDAESGKLGVALSRGYSEKFTSIISRHDPDPAYMPVVERGTPVYYSATSPELRMIKSIAREGITAAAVMPVRYEGRSIACINVSSHTLEEFPHEGRLFLEMLAVQVASTLSRLGAEEALRRSEEKFKSIIEHTSEIFFMHDMHNRMTYVSPQAEHLLGPLEDVEGKRWTDLLTENPLNETALQRTEEALRTGRKQESYLMEIDRGNGERAWLEIDESPVRDKHGEITGMVGIARDVTERIQTEKKLEAHQEQLRALTGRLQAAREEERAAIARELHDVVGQALTGLRFDLEWLGSRVPAEAPGRDKWAQKIDNMLKVLEETIQITRRLSTELRPPELEYFGIVSAMESQIHEWRDRTGIRCAFISDMDGDFDLAPECAIALYRVLQESLTNVARHASASRVKIRLKREGERVTLEVTDNGKGISEKEVEDVRSLGILGMKERIKLLGGEFTINGRDGKGTKVVVSLPAL